MGRRSRWTAAALSTVVVAGLLAVQAFELRLAADRMIGAVFESDDAGVLVSEVLPGLPAARAGLMPGDRLVSLAQVDLSGFMDLTRAMQRLERGRPAPLVVERQGRPLGLTVVPGGDVDSWRPLAFSSVVALVYLALGLLALLQPTPDLRARLLALFSLSVAFELSLPLGLDRLTGFMVVTPVYYLLTGLQVGFDLHLAAMIPERRRWLDRRPWVVPLFYTVGVVTGSLAAVAFLSQEVFATALLPWSWREVEAVFFDVGFPVWAIAVVALLAEPAFGHPVPRGRQQAGLVLLGVLPWALFSCLQSFVVWLGREPSLSLGWIEDLVLLCYPVAVFAAIFRHHLFDLELVVRRSLVYTTLTGALLLVFYATLGAGSALFSSWLGGESSLWVLSSATLLLGLLFAPLRRSVQRLIDRRFFPERRALRQRLIHLAGDLPALGNLPRMAQHLTASLCRIFRVARATVLIAVPEHGRFERLASSPEEPPRGDDQGQTSPVPLDDCAVPLLLQVRRPIQPATVPAGSLLRRRAEKAGILWLLPLVHQDRLVGVLGVGRKERGERFAAEELELLNLLSHHVATVLENARLFQSATIESLTGLLRREAILEHAERELERALRYGRPLTLGLADLDHFKEVNDRYGHLAGDTLLRQVARTMAASLRATDGLGRYGGEEFLLLLPETDESSAWLVAEKLRRQVAAAEVAMDDGSTARVTLSVGLASLAYPPVTGSGRSVTLKDLLADADRALYLAKRSGRNQVQPEPALAVVGLPGHE